ncbi:hypothetical protein ABNG03_00150 [Halorubrum sp. RMP-47]|uniref:Uncharacterized protein n=1 Tax=Halorubrum miltondacostae TaxID=3076378 RepID=A0ABD5M2K6_9EURY
MSSSLSAAEIEERIEKDSGPLNEKVIVKRSTAGTRTVYHNADDPCYNVDATGYRAGPERITRKEAQERGLAPCRGCIIGREIPETKDNELYERAKHFDPDVHDSLADVDLGGTD